jgi:hypothetical protein
MVSLHRNTLLSEDQSAILLTNKLLRLEPFIFIRYGDGALECINRASGRTCDGEIYTAVLGAELLRCWNMVCSHPGAVIGDWMTASFDAKSITRRYEPEYTALIGPATPLWIHYETLLLMRESAALLTFYNAIRNDPRRKLIMGPEQWRPAADLLKADFFAIPVSTELFRRYTPEIHQGLAVRSFDILLYGAGMAGNVPVIDNWAEHPERTYINLGSALDPLYRGRTRMQQLTSTRARAFMARIGSL